MINLSEITAELDKRFMACSKANLDLTSEQCVDLVLSDLMFDVHSKDPERVVAAAQILWVELAEEDSCPTHR